MYGLRSLLLQFILLPVVVVVGLVVLVVVVDCLYTRVPSDPFQ